VEGDPMATVTFDSATRVYPGSERPAVDALDLEIGDGEFLVLVGPSGCGKSTSLRMLAGLEEVNAGQIRIGDRDVTDLQPKDRDIAMVFQNYALYPHMSVAENMGFALKLAGTAKDEIRRRVQEAAKILDLVEYLDRKPKALSGGQRQRVAMGRAIVREPQVFLMDEPLSNLDAKLRVQMRTQVSRIQHELGTTTVYVTHDQTEAMTLGDRVAVLRGGVLQQVDTPKVLYERPDNLFVAGFIGSPAMNFMPATVEGESLKLPVGDVPLTGELRQAVDQAKGASLIAGLRPEHFEDATLVGDQRDRGVVFKTTVDVLESMGAEYYAYFTTEGQAMASSDLQELAADSGASDMGGDADATQVVARLPVESGVQQGQPIELWFDPAHLLLFDLDTGKRLTT
jgi:multiple sugar transport system ATP-binding protein